MSFKLSRSYSLYDNITVLWLHGIGKGGCEVRAQRIGCIVWGEGASLGRSLGAVFRGAQSYKS